MKYICCFFFFFIIIIIGASYKQIYQHIEDWRHYMSYFVIESHQLCYRLFSTLQYDVIGRYVGWLVGFFVASIIDKDCCCCVFSCIHVFIYDEVDM